MTQVLLSGFYRGDSKSGVHYQLLRKKVDYPETMGCTHVYVISRFYGFLNGIPHVNVSVICADDGTSESYKKAYDVFSALID